MTRFPSLIARVLGTLVAAGLILVGMPMSAAWAAPTDHFTIVANNSPVTEGNVGTTAVTFTISYSGNPNPVSVDWATVDGTATAGSDYVAASGTASFNGTPSDRTKTVTVLVNDAEIIALSSPTLTMGVPWCLRPWVRPPTNQGGAARHSLRQERLRGPSAS